MNSVNEQTQKKPPQKILEKIRNVTDSSIELI